MKLFSGLRRWNKIQVKIPIEASDSQNPVNWHCRNKSEDGHKKKKNRTKQLQKNPKQTNKQTKTKQKQTYFQKLFFASFFSVKPPRIFLLFKKVKFQSFMNNHTSIYHHIITQVYKIEVESWSTSAFFLNIFSYWVQKWHPFLVYTAVFFANLKKSFFSKITFSLENCTCGINFL